MATKIVNVSELKAKLPTLLSRLNEDGTPIYVTLHGKAKAVVVKYEDYEALLEKLEDLEDVAAMQQSLARPDTEAISLEKYERQRTARLRR